MVAIRTMLRSVVSGKFRLIHKPGKTDCKLFNRLPIYIELDALRAAIAYIVND